MSKEPTSNMDEKVRHMTVILEVVVRHQHVIISLGVYVAVVCLFQTQNWLGNMSLTASLSSQYSLCFEQYRLLAKPDTRVSAAVSHSKQGP